MYQKCSTKVDACQRNVMSHCLTDAHVVNPSRPYTRSHCGLGASLPRVLSSFTGDHLEMMKRHLRIQKFTFLVSFLFPFVISTNVNSTCPTKDPVIMALQSSDESIGGKIIFFLELSLLFTFDLSNFPTVLETPGYPDFNSSHACTWKVQALHGGRVKVTQYRN